MQVIRNNDARKVQRALRGYSEAPALHKTGPSGLKWALGASMGLGLGLSTGPGPTGSAGGPGGAGGTGAGSGVGGTGDIGGFDVGDEGPGVPGSASIVERALEAARRIPSSALCAMNDWVRDFLNTDPAHYATAMDVIAMYEAFVDRWVVEEPDDMEGDTREARQRKLEYEYATGMKLQMLDAISLSKHWVESRKILEKRNLACAFAPGTVTRVMSPEAAVMESFLVTAEAKGWLVHEGRVFEDAGGYARFVEPMQKLLLDNCNVPQIRDYIHARPAILSSLLNTLATGTFDRMPSLVFDTTAIAFLDTVVRIKPSGLDFEPLAPLDRSGKAVIAPRAVVPTTRPGDPVYRYDLDAVKQWFPEKNPAFMARLLGAMFRPKFLAQLQDQWRIVVVAYGMADIDSHPILTLARTFIGHGVISSLETFVPHPCTAITDPYCLLIRAKDSTLDQGDILAMTKALDHNMVVILATPRIPTQMFTDPKLRLAGVAIEAHAAPVPEPPLGAILQTAFAEYNRTSMDRRQVLSPMFDEGSFNCRVNSSTPLTAEDLFMEMLQAGVGVRVVPGKFADRREIEAAFGVYQEKRGYVHLARLSLTTRNVVTAANEFARLFSDVRTIGNVEYLSSSEQFKNLTMEFGVGPYGK